MQWHVVETWSREDEQCTFCTEPIPAQERFFLYWMMAAGTTGVSSGQEGDGKVYAHRTCNLLTARMITLPISGD